MAGHIYIKTGEWVLERIQLTMPIVQAAELDNVIVHSDVNNSLFHVFIFAVVAETGFHYAAYRLALNLHSFCLSLLHFMFHAIHVKISS
jgi:hypothetical protein